MIVENLPAGVVFPLPQLGLILVGILIERHYISRVTCFTNSLALVLHVATVENAGFWLGLYADIGLILGLLGIVAYTFEKSLNGPFYFLAFAFYSGLPVGVVILSGRLWPPALAIASLFSMFTAYIAPSGYTFAYMESLPGGVYQYAKNKNILHKNHETGYTVEIDLLEALRD